MAARFDICNAPFSGELVKTPLVLAPRVLQNTRASTLAAALDSEHPGLAIAELVKRKAFTILHDAPDAATGMTRCKAYFAHTLQTYYHIWYCPTMCAAHQVHRTMVGAAEDSKMAGDVYATAFVASLPGHQSTMQASLRRIIDEELVVKHTNPDPEWPVHAREWCKHTIMRFVLETRGSMGEHEVFEHEATKQAQKLVDDCLVWANGDPRLPVVSHHWSEISQSRANVVDSMYAAFLNAGLLLSQGPLETPSFRNPIGNLK